MIDQVGLPKGQGMVTGLRQNFCFTAIDSF